MATTVRGASKGLRTGRGLSARARVRMVFSVFVLLALALTGRLFVLQVQQHADLSQKAEAAHLWTEPIPATRGAIYDINGALLAGNTTADDLYVDMSKLGNVSERRRLADLLAPPLNANPDDLYVSLSKEMTGTLRLKGNLSDAQSARMRELAKGWPLELLTHAKRAYPNGALLAHVLGYATLENVGAYGIEGYYEKQLGGTPGSSTAEHDALGNTIPLGQQRVTPPVDGNDLTLSIDMNVQYIAERALDDGMKSTGSSAGQVLIMDPHSGAIIAMASRPTFDPNTYYDQPDVAAFINPVVNTVYEPGSTFKTLVWSAGLNAGRITLDTTISEPHCIIKYGYTICNTSSAHYNETPATGLAVSDNIMAMDIAERLGKDDFYKYLQNFGIGQLTNIDLPGEGQGLVSYPTDAGWGPLDLDTNAFGQGISVTPLQLLIAVTAVANGGHLMQPYVVQRISDKQGKVVSETQPKVVRDVLSSTTTSQMRELMVGVVEHGTGVLAKTKGYRIAAKTGTAQIPHPGGGYEGSATIGSVVGFAPADDARFVMMVKLDRPQSSQWGENTAVPIFANIARELFVYYKVQPTDYNP